MKSLTLEMAPGADDPFYVEMATGDAAELYETYAIASLAVTTAAGQAVTGLTVDSAFDGSEVQLRFPAAAAGTYPLKVLATLSGPTGSPYVDWVFVTLYVRTP